MKVTVNETQSNEVDWSKNPQLVVSDYGTVVMTDKNQSESTNNRFNGIVVLVGKNSNNILGDYDAFLKNAFKPFHGSITLSND